MNKYKIISLAASAMIIVAGSVYLIAGKGTIGVVLAICALSLFAMGIASAAEQKSIGNKGIAAYLSAICSFVIGILVSAASVYWFITK